MFKNLLVAVDGSSHSIKVVKVAAELAHQLNSCIVIFM
jgi:nucleotide-binding universal stress UspA family protein